MAARKKDPLKENTITRRKNLLYKVTTYGIEPFTSTLEELLNAAWTATTNIKGRRQITNEESDTSMFLNYRSPLHGMTFFEVLAFTPGLKAAAANVDWDKPTLDVEDVDVKNDKGQKLQLIENMLHFGVSKNHVVILPSQAIRAPELEAHLNWFLKTTAILSDGQTVRLSNRVKPDQQAEIKTAKSIRFSTELGMHTAEDAQSSGLKLFKPTGKNWTAIRALLEGLGPKMADVASDLELSGLTESTPVDIDILLKWPKPKKEAAHTIIDRIATGLRHVESEIDYVIQTKHGKLTKKDFVLSRGRTVRCRGERPVRELLFESMHDWLTELLSTNEVV